MTLAWISTSTRWIARQNTHIVPVREPIQGSHKAVLIGGAVRETCQRTIARRSSFRNNKFSSPTFAELRLIPDELASPEQFIHIIDFLNTSFKHCHSDLADGLIDWFCWAFIQSLNWLKKVFFSIDGINLWSWPDNVDCQVGCDIRWHLLHLIED